MNDQIKAPQLRVIGANGAQLGVLSLHDARTAANEAGLDLIEVAPQATPPVAKIMDAGKAAFDASVRARRERSHAHSSKSREMKFRPQIGDHDYDTKRRHVERFLTNGDKVRITVMFRGRQQTRPEIGRELLDRLATDLADLATVDAPTTLNGRDMRMTLAPARRGFGKRL